MCGIGGRTIAEAQQRLSYDEFCRWVAFRRRRGSLHWGMRIERSVAQLSTLYANAHRKKGAEPLSIHDFMSYEDEPELTLEQAMEQWA